MRLPWRPQEIYNILTPRVPYLKNLPTILWHDGDMCAVCVKHNSQKSLKEAASILGHYFNLEKEYNFAPYEPEFQEDKSIELILFMKQEHCYAYYVMGCMEFDYGKKYSNIPIGWMLSWAWMHPYCRGQGYVGKAFPSLVERYGDFYFLDHLSKPMLHLMSKYGSDKQKELVRELKIFEGE